MLNQIIHFSLHNRLLVLAATVLLLVVGTYTAIRMEVDVFPDLTAPTVVVLTEAHGMAPEEVERLVTFPLETAVNGATSVRRVRSSSALGISIVWVEFEWGTDIFRARQIVTEKLTTVADRLPGEAGAPTLAPNSSIMGEIMLLGLTSDSLSVMELRTLADWTIRPRLLSVGGVSQVVVIGGEYKQYQVLASPLRMKQYGVSLEELLKASREASANASGGFMNQYGNEYIIRGVGRTGDPGEIGRSVIKVVKGYPVRIEEVAQVRVGAAPKIGDGSLKGKPAVILTVMKQPNTNTLSLTRQIDQTLAELAGQLPGSLQVHSRIFRQADFIDASIGNIRRVLVEGSLFVVVILFVFLLNARATVISLLAIPVSLLVAILTLKWLGFTINTMSLGGMAIAVGDLVDDAIIDVENVLRRLRENARLPAPAQKNKLRVIYEASTEIRTSVIHATFIIIIAFLPLFFLSGMEGRLLAPLGVAFIVSLFASLVVALTLTPVLCSYLLTDEERLRRQDRESPLVRRLNRWYEKALRRTLGYGKTAVLATIVLVVLGIAGLLGLGRSFLPEFNEGSLVVSAITLPGTSLEESNRVGRQIETSLLEIPEITVTTRRTGRAELDEHAQGVNASEIDAPFVLKDRSREEFLAAVREKLAFIGGVNITIGQPIGHRIDHMLSGTRANIAIKVFGPDLSRIHTIAGQVKARIEGIEGLVDLSAEPQIQVPELQIKARRDMLARYGIPVGGFTGFVDAALAGEAVGQVYEENRSYALLVRFDEKERGRLEDLRNLLIDSPTHGKIPLYYVADIVSTTGPGTINRENTVRRTIVSANVSGRDQRSVVAEIQARVNRAVRLPEGYRIEYGGQFEAEAEASRTLLFTSLLAIGVIFLLLHQAFRETRLAGIILLNLPLALIGGVMSLYLSSGILSIPAIIGFITLFGIATRNGILLISHYQTLHREGLPVAETVIKGSVDRLPPILMTALCAALALIPLALAGDEPGNEIQSPMAKVILGGLLTSTLLNLFIVPSIYRLTHQKNEVQAKDI
ncbi:MAG: Cobalt-zinc-cadmium resistance protein CzcA; Cation efflux system protein CusA [uncultured Cytophagales bacterium]|uniref:Cobalt-zinc-cadmium resistance protein CzcA Cation efflux system protein CusA n=1 Tax=uncultured Cytophagales bacterium TaxID=158755 RepID=A0A6J4KED5_9SPHI|nr:MAG: Cobalt-zinc-cadmium resistance protein CzcA; Cation efflux system protein CusA [uncultured Cytophagales bacterium]